MLPLSLPHLRDVSGTGAAERLCVEVRRCDCEVEGMEEDEVGRTVERERAGKYSNPPYQGSDPLSSARIEKAKGLRR
jgi:hypothetical protein